MNNQNSLTTTVRVAVVLLVAGSAVGFALHQQRSTPVATVSKAISPIAVRTIRGRIGSEKREFLEDPEVAQLLHDRYHLVVEAEKAGSLEMFRQPATGMDFLWPSSQVAAQMYPGPRRAEEVIFRSPLVLYSWSKVTNALITHQMVQKIDGTYYVVDMPKFVREVNMGTPWSKFGLPELNGSVTIRSTNPTSSNSGMLFAGLLATIANKGNVVTRETLPRSLPKVVPFFQKLGFMEDSSADLFRQYIETGMGQDPIIVGYESQLIEFGIASPDQAKTIADDIRILYPRPTVWCDHPLIALNDNGGTLLKALRDDPDLRRIAWERHGFRTGPVGNKLPMSNLGIAPNVPNIVPAPQSDVMSRLLTAIKK